MRIMKLFSRLVLCPYFNTHEPDLVGNGCFANCGHIDDTGLASASYILASIFVQYIYIYINISIHTPRIWIKKY